MNKKFTELLEGAGLSEDAKSVIQEAWESNLAEAKEAVAAELREEFAQRYEHDKGMIVETVDNFFTTKLAEEMAELAEDKKQLSADRVKYRKAVREHSKVLDQFVTKMVAEEVKELRSDRAKMFESMDKLDNFIGTQLAEELKEFQTDKQALVEQKVKMIREGKKQLAEAKRTFVQKAARLVESKINEDISKEVRTFRDDITAARENDFGRKIFEAFAMEYGISYLNETKEIKQYQKSLADATKQLQEANQKLEVSNKKAQLVESKLRVANDKMARKEKLNELMRPLGKEKREIMSDLLESVQTDKLEATFKKYLPSVLDSEQPAKRTLKESARPVKREHTGDKKAPAKAEANDETDVVELNNIRKLAGLS